MFSLLALGMNYPSHPSTAEIACLLEHSANAGMTECVCERRGFSVCVPLLPPVTNKAISMPFLARWVFNYANSSVARRCKSGGRSMRFALQIRTRRRLTDGKSIYILTIHLSVSLSFLALIYRTDLVTSDTPVMMD